MKRIISCFLAALMIFAQITSFSHSGRTDSSGGHRDNKNKSGLGYYHYHHGYGPHLHDNGVCPYDVSENTTRSTTQAVPTNKSFIYKLQEKLNQLGFSCGTPDGIIGKKTKAAIRAFQKYKGLKIDGIVGTKTKAALGLE